MKTNFTLLLVLLNLAAGAQTSTSIQAQKSLGGSLDDEATSIQQTFDSGYIVAGYSKSNAGNVSGNHGYEDYWIVKLDKKGIIQWQKSLGGSAPDFATSIRQTYDSGYIVAGTSLSDDGDVSGHHNGYVDYWIVKLDKTGAIQWEKSLGGNNEDYATSVRQTKDGGYIVAGFSWSNDEDVSGNHGFADSWIVKLTNMGDIQWQKSLGGSGWEYAYSIEQTADEGYIVAGWSNSNDGDVSGNHGSEDYWIVKLKKTGDIQWQKSLGGSDDESAQSIRQTKDGGYIVAGYSRSNDGDVSGNHGLWDYWIVKLDNGGAIQWQKSLGGSSYDLDLINTFLYASASIQQAADRGYVIAGASYSNDGDVSGNHGSQDIWVVKLDKSGIIQWQKSLGGSNGEGASVIQQTVDGGYIVAGISYSNDGDVSGHHGSTNRSDYWIVKLRKATSSTVKPIAESMITDIPAKNGAKENSSRNFTVYPNPAKDILRIQTNGSAMFSLLDLSGKVVLTKNVTGNASMNVSHLATGLYYLKNNTTSKFQLVMINR